MYRGRPVIFCAAVLAIVAVLSMIIANEQSNRINNFYHNYKCVEETPITAKPPREYVCANYIRIEKDD